MSTAEEAARIIRRLGLEPHPEGGHYRETYRAPAAAGERSAVTLIYFLLRAGEVSRWHRIDATEIWHWYAGAPLALSIGTALHRLGPDVLAGETPQQVVPPGAWQSARSLGAWSLCGCSVAPGFSFEGFELAPAGWMPGA